jgi:hypothetical protein
MIPQTVAENQPPIKLLTLGQWTRIETAAKQAVKDNLQPPQASDFLAGRMSRFPRWLTLMAVGGLLTVITGAFVISIGKQFDSYDTIYGYLGTHARLSPFWVSLVLLAGVLLTEIGAALFTLAPAVFGDAHKRKFYAAAGISGGLAVFANVAATYGHEFPNLAIAALAWLLTLFAPMVVLIGALFGERLIIEQLERRNQAAVEFEVARREYAALVSHPEQSPAYPGYLRRYWLETYRRLLKDNAPILDNPEVVNQLMARDFSHYVAPNFTIAGQDTNLPALTQTAS